VYTAELFGRAEILVNVELMTEQIEKAVITERLTTSPCALVASQFGWSGNMERIMKAQAYQKTNDPNNQ